MTTIYLIRHAEAEGNLYRRIHGDYDSLLTDDGRVQIQALCRRFEDVPVDAVWASDRYRTMTTVGAIARRKGLRVRTDPDLREIHMGTWEDRPWGEKWQLEHDELVRFNRLDPDWHAPGGESRIQLGQRMTRAVRRIAESCPDGTVIIGSHGTAIQQFLADARGLTPDQWREKLVHGDNTAVSCVTWDGERFTVVYDSDNSHLGEDCSTLAKQNWWRPGSTERDVNLWYRPLNWGQEKDLYLSACRDAFPDRYDAASAENRASALLGQSPWAIAAVLDEGTVVGVVAMGTEEVPQGIGRLELCCLLPPFRAKSLGVQMIGQAVSYFRPMGVERLRLTCPEGHRARPFFLRYGFVPVAGTPLLEKFVGYEA